MTQLLRALTLTLKLFVRGPVRNAGGGGGDGAAVPWQQQEHLDEAFADVDNTDAEVPGRRSPPHHPAQQHAPDGM